MANLILNTDSYKASHWLQYPEGTEYVNSYIESRGGEFDTTIFFGLQMFLDEYMKPVTQEDLDEAEAFFDGHGLNSFNQEGWQYIINKHDGVLPVVIEAVPEGTPLASKNVLVQIRNTDPKCYWLPSYLETALLRAVWYPTTVASNSYKAKQIIRNGLLVTEGNTDGLEFKMHDFGSRGTTSLEAAGIGGAAHLVNFMGTDTVEGVLYARKYYGADMAGFSIPASEHSTMTTWGNEPGEIDAMRNMIEKFGGPGTLFACVSDSYDIFKAVRQKWGFELRDLVAQNGGCLVVRPDSGDPVDTPVAVIEELMDAFGHTVNEMGYKVLPDFVRVIQGDGITHHTIKKIVDRMIAEKLSIANIAFGQGAGLLQMVNRDTMQFAMKASAICINGKWQDVYKDPIGQKSKKSKRGILSLICNRNVYETIRRDDLHKFPGQVDMLKIVWHAGWFMHNPLAPRKNRCSFDQIRHRSEARFRSI